MKLLLFFRNIMSSSPNKYTNDQLQEIAKQHATKAVEFDRFNEFAQAYQHYMVYILLQPIKLVF
jgi:hypothetical protein